MELIVNLSEIKNIKKFLVFPISAFIIADKEFSSSNKGLTRKQLAQAICKIHNSNKKVIVKADRLFQEDEMDGLEEYLEFLNNQQCDCVLFSDMAVDQIKKEKELRFATLYAPETLLTNRYEIRQLKLDQIDGVVISKDIPLENALLIAQDSPDYSYLRIHGPILMSYSKRRFISTYLNKKEEYLDGYSLSEENRSLKMPIVEKKSGTWFYHSCLESTKEFPEIMSSKLKGIIIDNNLYEDDYTLGVLKIYHEALTDNASKTEELKMLNSHIEYTSISDIRLTQLEKEQNG